MGIYKLSLKDSLANFYLVAIHCGKEGFAMAFLLNKYVNLKLKRSKKDLEYTTDTSIIAFPHYFYEDIKQGIYYDLIANARRYLKPTKDASESLFSADLSALTTAYLIPEMKQVDYFLKITSEMEYIEDSLLIANIQKIEQVISAYNLDVNTLKSKNNLIFD